MKFSLLCSCVPVYPDVHSNFSNLQHCQGGRKLFLIIILCIIYYYLNFRRLREIKSPHKIYTVSDSKIIFYQNKLPHLMC